MLFPYLDRIILEWVSKHFALNDKKAICGFLKKLKFREKFRLNVTSDKLKQLFKSRIKIIILLYLIAGLQNGEHGKKLATGVSNASTAMNHLLLGKKPLVATKPRRGPHPGAIPSPKNKRTTKGDSSNNTTSTTHQIQRNSSATHYACPQVRTFNFA